MSALSAPTLTAEGGESAVELRWTQVSGADRYELRVYTVADGWEVLGGDSLTGTTYRHTDLTAGRTYYYWVSGIKGGSETRNWSARTEATASDTEAPTATLTATPSTQAPTQTQTQTPTVSALRAPTPAATPTATAQLDGSITGLTLSSDEPGNLDVIWNGSNPEASDYRVSWAKADEEFASSTQEEGNAYSTDTFYAVTGLEGGVEYKVRVRARYFDANGKQRGAGPWSDIARATVSGQQEDIGQDSSGEPGAEQKDQTRMPRQSGGPTVTIAGSDGVTVVAGANQVDGGTFDVTITFSEAVGDTFDYTDITLTNARPLMTTDIMASSSGLAYTATIRPAAGFSGTVTVKVSADAAQNSSDQGNQESNTFSVTVTQQSACVTGGAVPAGDANADLARDCATLLGLHDALVGNATLSPAWSATTDIETWQGIRVKDMRVFSLSLSSEGLDGSIPPELGDLSNLETLRLSSNGLTGGIPTELGMLTKLSSLFLHQNATCDVDAVCSGGLTGEIPSSLGSLGALVDLNLRFNRLTGAIPTELGSLTQLESLYLDTNDLVGPIPDSLGDLSVLEDLVMGNNEFDAPLPTTLTQLGALQTLDVRRSRLTGAIPDLYLMTSLRSVFLQENALTGTIADLSGLADLKTVDVDENMLSGPVPNLSGLLEFRKLSAQYNQLTGTIPVALTTLSTLDTLALTGNQLTGSVPDFSGMANLQFVAVDRNLLDGTVPNLSNLPKLEQYVVHRNRLTGQLPTVSNVPELGVFWFHCNLFTGTIPASFNELTKLRRLLLFDNQLSGEIPDLSALAELEWLWLNHNYLEGDFSDTADLTAKLPNATVWLTLNGNDFVGVDRETGALTGAPPTGLNATRRDPCMPRAGFASAQLSATEGMSVTVTVDLELAVTETVTVPIVVARNGGASVDDYSGVPAGVTFNSGERTAAFAVTATDDSNDDDGESLTLSFGALPDGVNPGSPATVTVNLVDNYVPAVTVSYEQSSYSVGEGDDVTVKVILSADPERTVIVPIVKANQGGAIDDDYSGVPANVTFASGETEKSFSFAATDDAVDDDGEKVSLTFGALPAGVNAGTPSAAVVSITDNDDPSVSVSYENSSYSVAEGGSVSIKVTLSADPERSVTIPISKANQGGAIDDDYSGVPANVTFASGETEKSFSFAATDDAVDDDGEKVSLTFGALPAGVNAGTPSAAVVSITDNDDPSVSVSYENSSYSVAEGGSVSIKVTLSADPERSVTIPISKANQGGAAAADYSGVPANVTFASGETEKSFTFTAAQDPVDDDGEKVSLTFGALPAGVSAGSTDETTVSINDDDVPDVRVRYGQASYTVAEGGDVTVKVMLSADPERTVMVPIAKTNQGGASDADYSGVPASVTFASEQSEKSFTFSATDDDDDDDGGESVRLTFGALPAGVNAGTNSEAMVRISDDEDGDQCAVAGRSVQKIIYADERDKELRKVFPPRLFIGYPDGDLLGWKEPMRGLYDLWCYRVEMRTRGEDDSNYGSWEEFAAAVYDPPPPGNWTRINLGPRPTCTDRQYRVRLVYKNGNNGPWAKSPEFLHRCGERQDWGDLWYWWD